MCLKSEKIQGTLWEDVSNRLLRPTCADQRQYKIKITIYRNIRNLATKRGIIVAFPWQQRLRELAIILCYTCIANPYIFVASDMNKRSTVSCHARVTPL